MQCKHCLKPIGKFDRRIQLDDMKAELWGDRGTGQMGRAHTFDAGVFCGWSCVAAYATERASLEPARV